MKTRRHHNNTGERQIKLMRPAERAFVLAMQLGVRFTLKHSPKPTALKRYGQQVG